MAQDDTPKNVLYDSHFQFGMKLHILTGNNYFEKNPKLTTTRYET